MRRARPVALQHARGHGDVVEDAEAFAAIRERVVRAAGQVGGRAFVQRGVGGGNGGADRSAGALDHLRRPRKADAALDVPRHRAVGDARRHTPRSWTSRRCRPTPPPAPRCRSIGRDDALGEDALAQLARTWPSGNLWPSGSGKTKWSE